MPIAVFWFRRDLRLQDNAALYLALKQHSAVLPVFIFDENILNKLTNKKDARVSFIHESLNHLQKKLVSLGSSLKVYSGHVPDCFRKLCAEYAISAVYTNHDYEPEALKRDEEIRIYLQSQNIVLHTTKDQCVFEKQELVKDNGLPYTIFTPYSIKWKKKLNSYYTQSYPTEKYFTHFYKSHPLPIPSLKEIGFEKTNLLFAPAQLNPDGIRSYSQLRDFPAIQGTSRLSVHLRFGTISIRKLVREALQQNEIFLNELIWRDFYMMILFHFPQVVHHAFKPSYDRIQWRNNELDFEAWCNGKTGYPLVDAGMRELNQTGFMHNRVRMLTASFLTKHLLIDWRWGEAYFAEKLTDFDLSANNGGWQWAAGCGCDAAPYFRIFNPYEQAKKFDPNAAYIKKWVPEWESAQYAKPIVEHRFARERALKTYKAYIT